jgi:hypothetical protein
VIYPGVVLVDTTGIFVQSHEGIVPFTLSPSTNKKASFPRDDDHKIMIVKNHLSP